MSDKEFTALRKHLQLLGLNTKEVPSLQEFRRKYRELLKVHHPDKGGKTKDSQDLTEAARAVFDYLTSHPDKVPKAGTEDQKKVDEEHLRIFEQNNDLKQNKQSATFKIDQGKCSIWIEALEKYLD